MTFDTTQEFYETHRTQASEYCRELSGRMEGLRKQIKILERAFTVSANIKKTCELVIIPIKTIPIGVGEKDIKKQHEILMKRMREDAVFQRAIRELLKKEGHIIT